jgi:hypothetical protein
MNCWVIDLLPQPLKPKKGTLMKLKLQTCAGIAIVAIMLAAPATAKATRWAIGMPLPCKRP